MMMQGLRKAGQTWLGKLVIGALFSLLILSFAIWGIEDMFRNFGTTTVATVGSRDISVETVRNTYQTELQNLSRRFRRNITNTMARQLGLDQQVLGKLIAEAALDQRVDNLGLAISDATIAQAIMADPAFKGPNGAFDKAQFAEVLRNNGYTEQSFVREQRRVYLRQHLAEAIAGGVGAPQAMLEALHRVRSETRDIDYVLLDAGKITPPTPDEAALQKFFDERKAQFRAPEYRSINVLVLKPEMLAKADQVTDDEAKFEYERLKNTRFGSPERRRVQQLVFPNAEAAKAASDKIKAGTTFETIAKEMNASEQDYDLGNLTKAEVADPAVADAAFALKAGGVSEPVAGRFGSVIVRVPTVEPGTVKPFAEVEGEIKREIATRKARDAARDLHDKIEDQRASAKPLPEIAQSAGLALRSIDGVDANGRGRDGQQVADLPEQEALLRAAFASDIGVDNEAISTRDGGWIWYEVTKVDAPRDRTLAEVKPEVERNWREDAVRRLLSEQAEAMVKAIRDGKSLAEVAQANGGLAVKSAQNLKRDAAAGDVSSAASAVIFATPQGQPGTAPAANGKDRIVFVMKDAKVPPYISTTQEAAQAQEQLRVALGEDLMTQYLTKLQSELGVRINQANLRTALGSAE